jgi:lactate dehydrogenase-like 2-hydroxyacid dehydrogenase
MVLLLAPLPDFLTGPLRERHTVHDYFHASDKAALLREVGPSIHAIVMAGGTVLQPAMLDQLPALEIVSVNGVGYDGAPLDYLRGRGIRLTNTPDVLTDDVADIAVALVLMTSRRLTQANRLLHADRWSEGASTLTTKVGGKRAGIVGLGRIGKGIAHRLEAFGMTIGYTGRKAQPVPYAFHATVGELAAWSDFLIVACPGGEGTKHLINADVLRALGAKGTLINIARGSIVDEAALIEALRDCVIKCAGLDVFENEPSVPAELRAMEHVTLLPHVGSATRETRSEMARLVLENLAAHFAGQPLITPVI